MAITSCHVFHCTTDCIFHKNITYGVATCLVATAAVLELISEGVSFDLIAG